MAAETILFRARVPAKRLKNAEKVLSRLGLKAGDALNMLLAQIELQQRLPFEVALEPRRLLTAEQQAQSWTDALGEY